jgi:hypothetical protein
MKAGTFARLGAGTQRALTQSEMMALRRHTSCERLSIVSTPLSPPPWFGRPDVELCIIADDTNGDVDMRAVAIASMCRARKAEHEEVWAQLFIDGVFVDLVRAADVSEDEGLATFLARIEVPALYFDDESHRATVKFVKTVSRVVARGAGSRAPSEADAEADADAEFVATIGASARRELR